MLANDNHNSIRIGTKVMFFTLGSGIGAAVALLFAPKQGRELRQEIAEVGVKGRDKTLEAANRVKGQAMKYINAAEEKGGELLDSVSAKAAAFKEEIYEDAEKVGNVVVGAEKRIAISPRQIL